MGAVLEVPLSPRRRCLGMASVVAALSCLLHGESQWKPNSVLLVMAFSEGFKWEQRAPPWLWARGPLTESARKASQELLMMATDWWCHHRVKLQRKWVEHQHSFLWHPDIDDKSRHLAYPAGATLMALDSALKGTVPLNLSQTKPFLL